MKANMAFLLFAEFIHTYKTERMQPLHPLKTTQPSWRNQPCQVTMAIGMRTHFKNMMVKIKIFSQFLWNLCDVVKVQKVFENCVFLLIMFWLMFFSTNFCRFQWGSHQPFWFGMWVWEWHLLCQYFQIWQK